MHVYMCVVYLNLYLCLSILQARILEWLAISFSRRSFRPRDQTWVSCIAGRFFSIWATREALILIYVHIYTYMYAYVLVPHQFN